jgi:hypothetical protein
VTVIVNPSDVTLPTDAVIVALPTRDAVTTPPSTRATLALELLHVTVAFS